MWRSTKAHAARDHPLPPRTVHHAFLNMPPEEQTFYRHILGETRSVQCEVNAAEASGMTWHKGNKSKQASAYGRARRTAPKNPVCMLFSENRFRSGRIETVSGVWPVFFHCQEAVAYHGDILRVCVHPCLQGRLRNYAKHAFIRSSRHTGLHSPTSCSWATRAHLGLWRSCTACWPPALATCRCCRLPPSSEGSSYLCSTCRGTHTPWHLACCCFITRDLQLVLPPALFHVPVWRAPILERWRCNTSCMSF